MGNDKSVPTLEESVGNENSIAKPKVAKPTRWVRRFTKGLLLGSVFLLALVFVAHLIWEFSGSNRWESVGERNGVRVYTLKAPGSDLIQAKGVFRVRSTLAGIEKLMLDPDTCKDVGCYGEYVIEQVDDQMRYDYFRMDYPFPFRPRDFVVRSQVHQSPHTKEVLIEFAAAPDKAPVNDCCVRVTTMDNTWRLTPLEDGQVEIEFIANLNEGGFIPDLLLNMAHYKMMYNLYKLQPLFSKDKYQNAKVDFIKEK
jgi:hypothetical protein